MSITKLILQHYAVEDFQALRKISLSSIDAPDIKALCEFLLGEKEENCESATNDLIIQGWGHYYKAEYSRAANLFTQSIQEQKGWRSWAWLGLGKVATDYLDWHKASNYLLTSLQIAREENDTIRMSECYGALGEVAFRQGFFQKAYELFCLDKALISSGSSQHYRLDNYLAITAGRLGHHTLTDIKLRGNYYSSLGAEPLSSDYSLASLFMNAYQAQKDLSSLNTLEEGHKYSKGSNLPRAVIYLIKAQSPSCEIPRKLQLLSQAQVLLSSHYPLEEQFCFLLKAFYMKENFNFSAWEKLSSRTDSLSITIPKLVNIIDDITDKPMDKDIYHQLRQNFIAGDIDNLWAFLKTIFI